MILAGSRYEKARVFTAEAGRPAPFPGIRPRVIAATAGVIEHTVKAGDRLDQLARHYYGDDRRWWRIVDANPEIFYGGDLVLESRVGRVIVIPRSRG